MANKSSKKPVKKVTSQQMFDEFNRIINLLEDIKQSQIEGDKNFNYFFAVGMHTQEIKHSSFLAFLMDPNKNHGLKNQFLQRFLESLYSYDKSLEIKGDITPKLNADILRDCYFTSAKINSVMAEEIAALKKLCEDKDIEVLREVVINSSGELQEINLEEEAEKKSKRKKSGDGRMDILIKFNDSKTLVVIENKLGSPLHDDQLKKYEEGLNSGLYKGYNKIYVYLRIDGSAPLNEDGGYNANWCVYDYDAISGLISGILKEIKENTIKVAKKCKLKYILEDYMAILDNGNLQSKDGFETRTKIRKFLGNSNNRDLVETLYNYTVKDNNVLSYIYKWIETEINKKDELDKNGNKKYNFTTVKGGVEGRKSLNFTLNGLEKYKANHKVKYEDMYYQVSSNSNIGGFLIGFEGIRPTLQSIASQSNATVDIQQSCSLFPEKDRGFVDTSDLKALEKLNAALAKFLKIILTTDDIIKTL